MAKQSFVYGALILFAASLINRIIGFIYQVFIIKLIGAEGIGLFNMVYPIYIFIIVLATAGIPLAVSKFVAEEYAKNNLAGAYRILKIALSTLFITSTILTGIVILALPFLMEYIFTNPKVYPVFIALIPSLVIVSLCSCFRGFFQGLQYMTPTAITQIAEQIVRVSLGLCFAYWFLPKGIEYAAAGASIGVVIGELVGFLVMLGFFKYRRPKIHRDINRQDSYIEWLKSLFRLGIPVTLSRLVSTSILSFEAIMIPKRLLVAGYTMQEATTLYGQLTGIALTLLVLPTVITISLSTTLVPAISEAYAQKNYLLLQNRAKEALRLTILAGLPCLVVFFHLATDLTDMLFNAPEAGIGLKILSLGGIFLYLQQTTTGILQGFGKPSVPMNNLILGSLIELGFIYYLTAIPNFGLQGAAISINVSFVVVATLNLIAIARYIGLTFDLKNMLLKPLFAIGVMSLFVSYGYDFLTNLIATRTFATLTIIFLGFIIYFVTLISVKGIFPRDVERIPFLGHRLLNWLRR